MSERPRSHLLWMWFGGPSPQARNRRRGLLLTAALLGLLHLRAPIASLGRPYVWQKDLVQVHALAEAVSRRANPYSGDGLWPEPKAIPGLSNVLPDHTNPYPPTAGLLALPLAALPYEAVAQIWLVLAFASLLGAVNILTSDAPRPRLSGLAAGTGLVAWYPVWQEMVWGQSELIMLLPLILCVALWRGGRSVAAGVAAGLTLCLKPIAFAVVILFAVRRDVRAFSATLVTLVLSALVVTSRVGVEVWHDYFLGALPDVMSRFSGAWANVSLWSPLWRALGATAWQVNGTEGWLLGMGIAALSVAGLAIGTRTLDRENALGVALAASAVLPPIAWPHYMVLCLVPGYEVWRLLHLRHFPKRWTNLALGVAILLACDWVRWSNWLAAGRTLHLVGQRIGLPVLDLRPMVPLAALALVWLLRSLALSPTEPALECAVER